VHEEFGPEGCYAAEVSRKAGAEEEEVEERKVAKEVSGGVQGCRGVGAEDEEAGVVEEED